MSDWMEQTEEMVHSGRIKVPYRWWVGETGSRFFIALRDEQKILGTRCPKCDWVFVPPRKTCGRCFHPEMEWREVGPGGTLVTWTIPRYTETIHPRQPPFAFGIVRLDGADTGITHLVGEFRETDLRAGTRLEAVFREKTEGNILDICYFRPVRSAA
jgi:uncharacterized protein